MADRFFYCSVIDFEENIYGGTLYCPRKELVTHYDSHSTFGGRKASISLMPLVVTAPSHQSLPCAARAPVGLQCRTDGIDSSLWVCRYLMTEQLQQELRENPSSHTQTLSPHYQSGRADSSVVVAG